MLGNARFKNTCLFKCLSATTLRILCPCLNPAVIASRNLTFPPLYDLVVRGCNHKLLNSSSASSVSPCLTMSKFGSSDDSIYFDASDTNSSSFSANNYTIWGLLSEIWSFHNVTYIFMHRKRMKRMRTRSMRYDIKTALWIKFR